MSQVGQLICFTCFIVHVYKCCFFQFDSINIFSDSTILYFSPIKHIKMSSFKCENFQKKEGGPDRSVSVFSDSAIRRLFMVKLQTCDTEFNKLSIIEDRVIFFMNYINLKPSLSNT